MSSQAKVRLTAAQALIKFLSAQYIEVDGEEGRFFTAGWGIFGHGNVAGLGQAILESGEFRYHVPRNEQAMVLTAAAYAKSKNRTRAMFCTSSIGPGATNMITGAAVATVNRLPVLLLPGDIFARRNVAPVLQQVESSQSQNISVNDCFKPVSRYWDRLERPDQLLTALPEAMRVLTSPSETGAVTLAFPQDTQAEAYDYPVSFFEKRVWHVNRSRPGKEAIQRAAQVIKNAKSPLIIAGGGVIYSGAEDALGTFADKFGIPVSETQAGKGSLRFDNPLNLGAVGVTGAKSANEIMREADVIIGIGTRYNDFVTQSKTGFKNPDVKFVNINIDPFDAAKHNSVALTGDARETLQELSDALGNFSTPSDYRQRAARLNAEWDAEVTRIYGLEHGPQISQGEVIGAVNRAAGENGVLVAAAGSLPGDLHKLWRARHSKQYNMEYGYSTMGYEVAGGVGSKMAFPDREIFVMVGDGSYLMMSQEIVTSIQEGIKINVVLINNHGYASIGALSRKVGCNTFGTNYRYRNPETGMLDGGNLPVDFAANAASMGAKTQYVKSLADLEDALEQSIKNDVTTVTVIETDPLEYVPAYLSWWDVPVAEVSDMPAVKSALSDYLPERQNERLF